jgi:hypothetical protein
MALLIYCALLAEARPPRPAAGVAGRPVLEQERDGLRYWYSELTEDEFAGLDVRASALAFHEVVQAAFAQTAVIPFRYGALIASFDELHERHAGLLHDLKRLGDGVQMELRIVPAADPGSAATGTEYLRARQAALHSVSAAADTARHAVQALARDWRQKGTRTGIRCFALLPRAAIAAFRNRVQDARLAPDVRVRVSGPWPPTEFLDLQPAAPADIVGPAHA